MTKILLVEDDKSLREIYGVRLLAEGYDIVSAGDGEEALAMAIKEKPSLIVSDVMMPKISGFDMLDILRSTTETRDIKVIMMTALSSEDQRTRGEQLGADRYLVKSQVGIEDVVRTVHEVLGDAPTAAPAQAAFAAPRPTAAPVQTAPQPAPALAPAPAAAPQPVQAPQLTPAPAPASNNSLPRPTAPFSSQRPANLGDRVIHPLDAGEQAVRPTDISSLINQELASSTPAAAAPSPAEVPTLTPPPVSEPQLAAPQQTAPHPPTLQTPDAPRPPAPSYPQVPPREAPPTFTQNSDRS